MTCKWFICKHAVSLFKKCYDNFVHKKCGTVIFCLHCPLRHAVPGDRRSSLSGSGTSRRSSSEVIKRMLYGSATKDDLKNRNTLDEEDSGVNSDETEESLVSVDTRSRSDSLPKFILKKTTSASRLGYHHRRNSVEDNSERDASPSPPLNPDRPRLHHHGGSSRTLPRRTKSSSNTSISTQNNNRKTSYAFGSSTERFCNKQESETRSSQDNLSGTTQTWETVAYLWQIQASKGQVYLPHLINNKIWVFLFINGLKNKSVPDWLQLYATIFKIQQIEIKSHKKWKSVKLKLMNILAHYRPVKKSLQSLAQICIKSKNISPNFDYELFEHKWVDLQAVTASFTEPPVTIEWWGTRGKNLPNTKIQSQKLGFNFKQILRLPCSESRVIMECTRIYLICFTIGWTNLKR